MIATITLLSTLILSLLITRIGTIALMLTGLPERIAAFQSRSAFSGTGFTTKESEDITSDPQRRQIVMYLMVAGNIGIAAVVATSIASFNQTAEDWGQWSVQLGVRLLILGIGVLLILGLSKSQLLMDIVSKGIRWTLNNFTTLTVTNIETLLNLNDGYGVSDFEVEQDSWLESRSLQESKLSAEGVLVLGIRRSSGVFVGSPVGSDRVHEKDSIVVYGRRRGILELRERKKGADGDKAHRIAIKIQQAISTDMESKDPANVKA